MRTLVIRKATQLGFLLFFLPHLSSRPNCLSNSLIPTAPDLVQAFNTQTTARASRLGSLPLDFSHPSLLHTCLPKTMPALCYSRSLRITYGGVKSKLLCLPLATLHGQAAAPQLNFPGAVKLVFSLPPLLGPLPHATQPHPT